MAKPKKRLTPMRCVVTQNNAMEPPFRNAFWGNRHEGLYSTSSPGAAVQLARQVRFRLRLSCRLRR